MRNLKLTTILAVTIALLFGLQSQSFAQSFADAFAAQEALMAKNSNSGGKPEAPQPMPQLQGAACGTIGPQGGDATSIIGVNTAGVERTHNGEAFPLVPTFLVSLLSLSMLLFGLRSIIVQKRAPIWVVGSIAAGALLFAGFIWAAVSVPSFTFGYSSLNLFDEPAQLFDSTFSCL